ncbi:MAG: hypothetical protein COA58_04850 [Bacteroidetes bacterium]|nr:MAG: hypothetical protein COA58_04850 [Bacteroidota bacterium]
MQEYNKVDQQLHQLSQIIAKVNRTFVQKEEDDSHTNLYYDHVNGRIFGRWIEVERGSVVLSLDLRSFKFVWYDRLFKILKSYAIVGRTSMEIELEIESDLPDFRLSKDGFKEELHFKINDYSFINDSFELIEKQDLEVWRYWRNKANKACQQVLGALQQSSEIRIWPHHFDTGIYAIIPQNIGISFGLAMEDDMVDSPYFYMSGYPEKSSLDFSKVSDLSLGRWQTVGEWRGAVLPLKGINSLSCKETDNAIDAFIKEDLKWFLK